MLNCALLLWPFPPQYSDFQAEETTLTSEFQCKWVGKEVKKKEICVCGLEAALQHSKLLSSVPEVPKSLPEGKKTREQWIHSIFPELPNVYINLGTNPLHGATVLPSATSNLLASLETFGCTKALPEWVPQPRKKKEFPCVLPLPHSHTLDKQ